MELLNDNYTKREDNILMDKTNASLMPAWKIKIQNNLDTLSPRERRVGECVLDKPDFVLGSNIKMIAERSGVSEASVVRFIHSIGYAGLKELKAAIASETVIATDGVSESRKLELDDDMTTIKNKVFLGCIEALSDTLETLDTAKLEEAVDYIYDANYIEILGLGGSASVARSAVHCFKKIGLRMNVTTSFSIDYTKREQFDENDVIIAISFTGETRELVEAARTAKLKGATVISITNHANSSLAKYSDCVLLATGRENMLPKDKTYQRVAQIAIIHALYAGVALRKEKEKSLKS